MGSFDGAEVYVNISEVVTLVVLANDAIVSKDVSDDILIYIDVVNATGNLQIN